MTHPQRVGLALGGGIVRGIAHVGVLQALVEAGIPIDCVAGTSAGSIVGAAYCAGLSLETIESIACGLRWWHIARPAWPVRGFISFKRMEAWLTRAAGDLEFNTLRLPLILTATDLNTGSVVYLREGKVAPAVHASCVVPGMITPVLINGRLLGDGSLVNTIPVHPLREMGADYIIGVDLFQHKIRRWMGPLGYGLAALEITFSRAGCGYCTADCLISPELIGKTYLNFWKAHELLSLGRRATEAKIPEIKAALGITG